MKNRARERTGRFLSHLVVIATLGVLAVGIGLITFDLRQKIRRQITDRDAEILRAVTLTQQLADDPAEAVDPLTDNPADQLALVVRTAQLEQAVTVLQGAIGARLFDPQGNLITTFPVYLSEATLDPSDLHELGQLKAVSRFIPRVNPEELFLPGIAPPVQPPKGRPVLEVTIPLHRQGQPQLLGGAQFVLDGSSVALQFARLDRDLFRQAIAVWVVGTIITGGLLTWAFSRLRRANQLLAARTNSLIRANHDLALAAKTSAVGAVASHLIHGLKNPLFGLQCLSNREDYTPGTEDWQLVADAARRMQDQVSEVVRILRENARGTDYEVSLVELVELLATKLQPTAQRAGIELRTSLNAIGTLSNHKANLIILVLDNLLHNAIQASPKGSAVELRLYSEAATVVCQVTDQGSGVSPSVRNELFAPGKSTKEGGSGIGLAISKQLANHLDASLELKSTSSSGSVFALVLPAAVFSSEPSVVG